MPSKIQRKLKDREVVAFFRSIGAGWIVASGVYLLSSASYHKWLHVLLGWVVFTIGVVAYQRYVRRKRDTNFKEIVRKTGGTIKRGSSFFDVPPILTFLHKGKHCQITHSVDTKFDHMIEYVYPLDTEMELRMIRPRRSDASRPRKNFVERCIVQGEDKDFITILLLNLQNKIILEEFLREFRYLTIGKDGRMRLSESYDSDFTHPERVLSTFDSMVKLATFIETRFKRQNR